MCDNCRPGGLPWDHVTDNDIVDASQVFDPAYTILETVLWNQVRAGRKYPFGVKTLVRLLTGNDSLFLVRPKPCDWRCCTL